MTDGLFPEPEHYPHELSEMYQTAEYRSRKGRASKFVKYAARHFCDECFALQHENRHQLKRVRAKANTRRTVLNGPDLLLCAAHAALWRELDNS